MALFINGTAKDIFNVNGTDISNLYVDGVLVFSSSYVFDVVVKASNQPTAISVTGGTLNYKETSPGVWRVYSDDTITYISWYPGKNLTDQNITSVDVVTGDTLTNINAMLTACEALESFNWNGSVYPLLRDCSSMFQGCVSLLRFTGEFDFESLRIMEYMFAGTSVSSLPVIDPINVLNIGHIFDGASKLVCIGGIDTRSASNTREMFTGCTSLVAPDATDQTAILAGALWTNPDVCPEPSALTIYMLTEPLVDDAYSAPIYLRTEALVVAP